MTEVSIEEHGEEERSKKLLMMDYEKNCFECRRLHVDERTCDAFPDGIPAVLLYGDAIHNKPFQGDRGMQFAKGTPVWR